MPVGQGFIYCTRYDAACAIYAKSLMANTKLFSEWMLSNAVSS